MEEITVEKLIAYCSENNRMCPKPKYWNKLWQKLLIRKRNDTPPVPLILAAWWDTPGLFKELRLKHQIEWANENGLLPVISTYLLSLEEDNWHHYGE